jgi:hypothetical protein
MTKELWIVRYGFESLVRKVKMILEKWTLKDMSDETLCFTKT